MEKAVDHRRSPDLPGSRAVAAILVVSGVLLRLLYVLHHPVNSDEPQHLHVTWAWTHGLLPYRDVFDNHSPLFSMLMAPVLALVGERADVVVVMRLAMIPLVAAALAATWVIARRLYGATTAWWAVAMAAVFPDYLRASIEYRSDQLWSALWLWSLAALVGGPLSLTRCFVTGLLAGAALSTSMKTVATGAGLAMALVAVALASSWRRPVRWLASRLLAAIAGGVLVPALLMAYFASQGALAAMRFQMTSYNLVSGLGLWSSAPWRIWLSVPCALAFGWLAALLMRGTPGLARGRRRALVFFAGGLYWTSVETIWPLVTHQDFLPVFPIAALALAVMALALGGRAARGVRGMPGRQLAAIGVPAAVVVLLVAIVLQWEPPWRDATVEQRTTLAELLRLTRPGEFVLDYKGESIFRPRPTTLTLEEVTLELIAAGRLKDDIQARMIATATPVVTGELGRVPEGARRFIEANYLPVGRWLVAGLRLDRGNRPGGACPLALQVASRYVIVTARGPGRGMLDGTPVGESRFLAAGPHEYRPAPGEGAAFLLWAPAVERGFLPAGIRDAGR